MNLSCILLTSVAILLLVDVLLGAVSADRIRSGERYDDDDERKCGDVLEWCGADFRGGGCCDPNDRCIQVNERDSLCVPPHPLVKENQPCWENSTGQCQIDLTCDCIDDSENCTCIRRHPKTCLTENLLCDASPPAPGTLILREPDVCCEGTECHCSFGGGDPCQCISKSKLTKTKAAPPYTCGRGDACEPKSNSSKSKGCCSGDDYCNCVRYADCVCAPIYTCNGIYETCSEAPNGTCCAPLNCECPDHWSPCKCKAPAPPCRKVNEDCKGDHLCCSGSTCYCKDRNCACKSLSPLALTPTTTPTPAPTPAPMTTTMTTPAAPSCLPPGAYCGNNTNGCCTYLYNGHSVQMDCAITGNFYSYCEHHWIGNNEFVAPKCSTVGEKCFDNPGWTDHKPCCNTYTDEFNNTWRLKCSLWLLSMRWYCAKDMDPK